MPKRERSQTLSSSATPPRKSNKTLKRRKSNRLSKSVPTEIVTYNLFEKKSPKKTQICDFVNEMKNIPQIVNLPTPPERHAIFVNVMSENSVIISDWGGNGNVKRNSKGTKWKYYRNFIECLEKKYANVEYYDVNEELYNIADEKHAKCDHGGCSEYLDLWLNKIYTEGRGYKTYTVSI